MMHLKRTTFVAFIVLAVLVGAGIGVYATGRAAEVVRASQPVMPVVDAPILPVRMPLTTGIVALVVVSLLTPPEAATRMESFFARLTTSSDEPETAGRPLLLVSILDPVRAAGGRGWRAFREDLVGLALGFALVAALVAGTALLLSM